MTVTIGQNAPDFTLKSTDGADVSLSDLRGNNVVIFFYPRDNTPGCTKEACGFRDLWDDIRDTGTEVIGVSPDDAESHAKFVDKYNLPFTLLCDPQHKVMSEYGAYGEKNMYGIKTIGVIRSTVIVDREGRIAHHWKRVPKASAHPARVLEVLSQMA
ncbi:MAG: peroxiredoxin [Acidiferrobacterales bacterium]|nr:peroxiredoxin [Acidiferrobacterales bacterium]